MSTNTNTNDISLTHLEEAPSRALLFLRGVGTSPVIRSGLAAHGYSEEEHALGWEMLHRVSGYAAGKNNLGIETDPVVLKAVHELDAWDEPNFARIEATLHRYHPEQAAFVFDSLQPAQGPAAVLSVQTLLDRLDALEKGTDRKATHKEDLAAIKLLEQRGYTKAMRDHLRAVIKTAQKGTAEVIAAPVDPKREKARQDYEAGLKALHAWHKDWATTARAVLKRRDYQIRLGLLKRKSPTKTRR